MRAAPELTFTKQLCAPDAFGLGARHYETICRLTPSRRGSFPPLWFGTGGGQATPLTRNGAQSRTPEPISCPGV